MRTMYDAAYPPALPPPTDAVAFYIGGDAVHDWFPNPQQDRRYRLPIFVRDRGGDPIRDADAAGAWGRLNGQPQQTCTSLDLETRIDRPYCAAFDQRLLSVWGYLTLGYGSRGNLFLDTPFSGGTWVATLDGRPVMFPGADATQWVDDRNIVDLSLVGDQVRLWDTAPGPPAVSHAPTVLAIHRSAP